MKSVNPRAINKGACKGQAAIEYLVTYGWAILVMLVIGLVLWQMGIFDSQSTPPRCIGFSQIEPLGWKAASTGDFILVLTNEAGTKLKLTGVNMGIFGTSCTSDGTTEDLRPGEAITINVTGCTGMPGVGEYYRANITISYEHIASGIPHSSVGTCLGDVE